MDVTCSYMYTDVYQVHSAKLYFLYLNWIPNPNFILFQPTSLEKLFLC